MDNACIHHGDEILELADRFGEFTQVIGLIYANVRPMVTYQVFALNIFHHTHLI